MTELLITSPLAGWVAPLSEAPDPVFAGRMMGDGVAIHPLNDTMHAPCDGVVVSIHAARHAVTLRSPAGAEVLIHLGLETVALKGDGFEALVAEGVTVARGDPLIRFDLDAVARRAASLVTPMIVTNGDRFAIEHREVGRSVVVGDPLMRLVARDQVPQAAAHHDGAVARRSVRVPMAHGVHARPAARIGACVRPFDAAVSVFREGRQACALSPIELLSLGVRHGDEVLIEGRGPDAEAAVAALAGLVASGMGEADHAPPPLAPSPPPLERPAPGQLAGVMGAPGLAIGPAAWLAEAEITVDERAGESATERAKLEQARMAVRDRIAGLAVGGAAGVMDAHLALLDDPALVGAADEWIRQGLSAGVAWRDAVRAQAERLRATGDARLTERVDDLMDLERQVLRHLGGVEAGAAPISDGAILLAPDLLPSELVALRPERLAGICLQRGGPTSHVAILCAGLGVPLLVAMGDALLEAEAGATVALDADAGRLHLSPDEATTAAIRERIERRRARRVEAEAASAQECRTADGVRIEAFANLGSAADARAAVAAGAEGSGLVRTEFLFLDRDTAPGEDEQAAAYQAIVDAMVGRPVIFRLLDVGGDKPAPYIAIGPEENPALGLRGIRVGLRQPELLAAQLRALLRVRPLAPVRIMAPMIASVAEVRAVRAALDEARAALGIVAAVPLGVMVETPAAAATADLLAAEVDFLSIGTNDLTQYVLAMDRGNAAVAGGVDALHPAVLRMISQTVSLASRHGKPVGVCGGLASDPAATPILIGLDVVELSSVPGHVAEAKAAVRRLDLARCRAHAGRALALGSAAEVRALARVFDEETAA